MSCEPKICPTCGGAWLRSDRPNADMEEIFWPLFDTEVVMAKDRRLFFGQWDAAGRVKSLNETNMCQAGTLAAPQEFKCLGLRWMTNVAAEEAASFLSLSTIDIGIGRQPVLRSRASAIPIGKLEEIIYDPESPRNRWIMSPNLPTWSLAFSLRWGEVIQAILEWPSAALLPNPRESFKLRLVFVGHLFVPRRW